jgi:hypothetical protein
VARRQKPKQKPGAGTVCGNLIWNCIKHTDTYGRIVSKYDNPMRSDLSMEYAKDGLTIRFSVSTFAVSWGGGFSLEVRYRRTIVLKADGPWLVPPHNTADIYRKGAWEELIPEYHRP